MSVTEYKKPLPPRTNPEWNPYWEGAKKHQLLIQRCKDCGAFRHPPQPMCPHCHSFEREWAAVSGKGEVHTWTVAHRSFVPGFDGELPLAIVVVQLPEGVRLLSHVVDVKPNELHVGMPVEVVFDDVTEDVTLPKFKRAT